MRSFLIAWMVAFLLVAVVAGGVSWYVGAPPPPTPTARKPVTGLDADASVVAAPFAEADALEVVARLLPAGAAGDDAREQLEKSATVTFHSAQHWRVCFDGACWVAHGPGRYAEAENDAARQREGASRTAP